ncbi:unnamed protein product [Rotaria magnacalcarata]|uniref:F-box domain-containing protein n=1 Tax=Rotaria magnacalcarata TaxID=392030 RepID=A0A819URJ3_9BILA|nr:unnamed protein product [Rotaria magnacalcarata]
MNVLNNNDINILDLPDEILSIIFNKLKTIDIFYSLLGVCSKILPRINDKITKLTLDPFSTEHILSAVKYPQLHSLSLDNYQSHILLRHLKDGEIFCVNDQITDLTVNIYHAEGELSGKTCQIEMFLIGLSLQLSAIRAERSYIDGNQLYEQVRKYLPRLNKFMFNIHTHIVDTGIKIDLPSNEDIRNSFIKRGFQSVGTGATKTPINNKGDCHVYSLPYLFDDFLFLKEQQNNQHRSSTLLRFNHLFKLNLINANKDYVKQFLSQRKTSLPCLTNLKIRYSTLASVTNDFTNDETRLNCTKIKSLYAFDVTIRSQNFDSYFPSLCNFS